MSIEKMVDGGGVGFAFLIIAVALAAFVGWVMNIVTLVGLVVSDVASDQIAMVVVRAAGIFFAPLGAVLGYI